MLTLLLEALYYGLKSVGLLDKLLAVHRAKEAQNALQTDNCLDDDAAAQRLRSKYQRD